MHPDLDNGTPLHDMHRTATWVAPQVLDVFVIASTHKHRHPDWVWYEVRKRDVGSTAKHDFTPLRMMAFHKDVNHQEVVRSVGACMLRTDDNGLGTPPFAVHFVDDTVT